MKESGLETRLLAAHRAHDLNRLVRGYTEAADLAEGEDDTDRACFFLTQAWIFALDAGDPRAMELKARLVAHGREVER